jgi:hypothetical protein
MASYPKFVKSVFQREKRKNDTFFVLVKVYEEKGKIKRMFFQVRLSANDIELNPAVIK